MIRPFLWSTALAYVWGALAPEPHLEVNDKPIGKNKERLLFLALAGLIALSLKLNNRHLFTALGALYSLDTVLTYLGYVKWRIKGFDRSEALQAFMAAWDLALSACFLHLAGVA